MPETRRMVRRRASRSSRCTQRASARGGGIPKYTLGSLVDMIEVATLSRSISSSAFAGVQFMSAVWPVLRALIAAMKPGELP